MKLLNEHDAAFVQIDEPKFKTSIRQNQLPNITSIYYLRAHGRNWKKWWHHEHNDERYDYQSQAEPDAIKRLPETRSTTTAHGPFSVLSFSCSPG